MSAGLSAPGRKWHDAAPLLVAVAAAAVLAYWVFRPAPPPVPPPEKSSASAAQPDATGKPPGLEHGQPPPQAEPQAPPAPGPATAAPSRTAATPLETPAPRSEPTPETRQLVAALTQLAVEQGLSSPEAAQAWKQVREQLAAQGPAAAPAIREFLEKNLDLPTDAAATGFPSLRLGLLDALFKAGGPEAIGGLLQTLQTTSEPSEIAAVAKYLDQADSAKYREAALAAIREGLSFASGHTWDGRDVAPLFEALKQLGGANTPAELQAYAGKWFDYVPLALAQLPDGAGVPALIRLAETMEPAAPGGDTYAQMLAQMAVQYPEAAEALVAQARAGRIPSYVWSRIAAGLMGATLHYSANSYEQLAAMSVRTGVRTVHIELGNQNLHEFPPSPNMPAEEATQRLKYVDQLLASTTDPAAVAALQEARKSLSTRVAQ